MPHKEKSGNARSLNGSKQSSIPLSRRQIMKMGGSIGAASLIGSNIGSAQEQTERNVIKLEALQSESTNQKSSDNSSSNGRGHGKSKGKGHGRDN